MIQKYASRFIQNGSTLATTTFVALVALTFAKLLDLSIATPLIYLNVLLFFAGFFHCAKWTGRQWSVLDRKSQIFILLQTVFWISLSAVFFPGFMNVDFFYMMKTLNKGELSYWHSYMFSALILVVKTFDPTIYSFTLFKIFLYISVLIRALRLRPIPDLRNFSVFFALTLFPIFLFFNLLLNRDVLYYLISAHLLLTVAEMYFHPHPQKKKDLLKIIFIQTLLLVAIRMDAFLILVALPLTLLILKILPCKRAVFFSLGLLAAGGTYKSMDLLLTDSENTQSYALTSIYHPLNHILYFTESSLSTEAEAHLSKVISVENMSHSYEPYNINEFHQQHYTLPVSASEWSQFVRTYIDLGFKNPSEFFKERSSMLLATLNIRPNAFIDVDLLEPEEGLADWQRELGYRHPSAFKGLRLTFSQLLSDLQSSLAERPISRFIFLSPCLFILLGLWGALRSKKFRTYYMACFIYFMGHYICVYLTAPEAQMKYYMDFAFFSVVMILLTADFHRPQWTYLKKKSA